MGQLSSESKRLVASEADRIRLRKLARLAEDEWSEIDRSRRSGTTQALAIIAAFLLILLVWYTIASRPVQAEPGDKYGNYYSEFQNRRARSPMPAATAPVRLPAPTNRADGRTLSTAAVKARPEECPHKLWCGCALSVLLFGESRRDLWLARNWLKLGKPIDSPKPGAVAVFARKNGGHVGLITKVLSSDRIVLWSGNDHNAVRERPRSTLNIIGYRQL